MVLWLAQRVGVHSRPSAYASDFTAVMRRRVLESRMGPGAHFSKVSKRFRARKAITKILNLMFTELFF